MLTLTGERLKVFLNGHEAPCISLYQPTHRRRPDNQQDPILFKNLLQEVEGSLRVKYPAREVNEMLSRFQNLAGDPLFWNRNLDGLAVLASPSSFEVIPLQRPVRPLAVVADHFHLKPLLRFIQSADRYQVLCLNRHEAKLFQGDRFSLDPIVLAGFPATLTQALGEEVTERERNVASYGKGTQGPVMHHGHGTPRDDIKLDTERFFRLIDREVLARLSRPSGLPLVLAALPEHQGVFRGLSQNPLLLSAGVTNNPDALTPEQLREEVWRVLEPQYVQQLGRLCDDFRTAFARQKGSGDLSDVARAAVAGRVGTLLVEADRLVPGKLDTSTGDIQMGQLSHPEVGDLIDDVAELVLRNAGQVVVVPAETMPTRSGLAATYRY